MDSHITKKPFNNSSIIPITVLPNQIDDNSISPGLSPVITRLSREEILESYQKSFNHRSFPNIKCRDFKTLTRSSTVKNCLIMQSREPSSTVFFNYFLYRNNQEMM